MGGTSWSDAFYHARKDVREKTNTPTFAYSAKVAQAPMHERHIHASLNPKGIVREARDSEAHPTSNTVQVWLDITGSMKTIPQEVQKKLPSLMGQLLKNEYLSDPQILFGAVGDEFSDQAVLQVGQFESGIEMEDHLTNLWLEGRGGGSNEESYQLALYFATRKTSIDAFEKRHTKGFVFIIGDETCYDAVTPASANTIFGDVIPNAIPVTDLVREAKELYHVFFIVPSKSSCGTSNVPFWNRLLGPECVLVIDDTNAISELIASVVGIVNKNLTVEQVQQHMVAEGVKSSVITEVVKSVRGKVVQPDTTSAVTRL